ncbi:MAG TPA: DUF4010 domain-containing protein [Kofleriaceae bacterium]|nr:DUF4010 domain-containing protein [Kofleriaceae bacterium]
MDGLSVDLFVELLYAVGVGLVVGFEREHSDVAGDAGPQETPEEHGARPQQEPTPMGVRTFALLSLLGWILAVASGAWPWLAPIGLAAVAALVVAQYVIHRQEGHGLTTEVAALVVCVSGMLVHVNRPLAVALALASTLLLISKPFLRSLVVKLRRAELTATLQLLVLLGIVLPMLPGEPLDPWQALPPRKIGLFVVLIGGISWIGWALSRMLGPRRSAGLTGLVGGLASSTATTVAMAQAARRDPAMRLPGQMAVFLACAVMIPRVLIVSAVISRDVAVQLAVPLAGIGLVMLGGAAWKWRAQRRSDQEGDAAAKPPVYANPFALLPALKWAALLCAVLLLATGAQRLLGGRGVVLAAGASGLADVDAITIAVSHQAGAGTLSSELAALALAIAIASNTLVKAALAWFGGGRRFGADIALVFAASMVLGATLALRPLLW